MKIIAVVVTRVTPITNENYVMWIDNGGPTPQSVEIPGHVANGIVDDFEMTLVESGTYTLCYKAK